MNAAADWKDRSPMVVQIVRNCNKCPITRTQSLQCHRDI